MKGSKKNKKDQPKEVKIGLSSNNMAPKIVSKKSSNSSSKWNGSIHWELFFNKQRDC